MEGTVPLAWPCLAQKLFVFLGSLLPAGCLCDFPVVFDLASTARSGRLVSRLIRKQRRPFLAVEVGLHRCL
jgi:hypothetical protein